VSTQTSESLLMRLRLEPADDDAWGRFVDRYGPLIRAWCRARGLGEADTHDVCQDVLAKLVTALKSFSYDPMRRFRGWLRTIVVHSLHDHHRQRRHQPTRGSGDTGVIELLANQEARDDLIARLDQAFDLELLERAMAAVQARVAPHNWQAFVLTVLEGRPVAETARVLEIHEGIVYVARCKIQKMLKCEILRLESASKLEESPSDDARRLSPREIAASVPRTVA
jgi:RNA polymerase sigma-70 factor, ECF subfamily